MVSLEQHRHCQHVLEFEREGEVQRLPERHALQRKRFRLVATPVRLDFRDGANPFAGRKNPLTERQVKKKRRLMRHTKR